MLKSLVTVFGLSSMLLWGCAGRSGSAQAGPHGHGHMCPMALEGTSVTAEDTSDGVALVFTTTGDVENLRQRVTMMAEKHNAHAGDAGSGEKEACCACKACAKAHMIAATARGENMEGGAKLIFTPTQATQLEDLRKNVREHAAAMTSGGCPMHRSDKAS